MNARYKSTIFAIAAAMILLVAYFFVRPGLLEKEYLKRLDSASTTAAWNLERFDRDKVLERKDFQKYRESLEPGFAPLEYFAVFNTAGGLLYRHTRDRESELFYSVTQDLQSKKITAKDSPLVRFYNQKKYYVFVREIKDGTVALSSVFRLTRKDIIRVVLELSLIVLLSIAAGTLFYIALYRSGRAPSAGAHRVIRVGSQKKAVVPDEEKKRSEISDYAAENLKNYVFELFSAISAGHAPDTISLYIMNRESTRMAKTFEMKGRSFIKIDAPDLDVIEVQNEIGAELKKASTLVLSNGNKLILPVLFRNSLLGAVNIIRGIPFKGVEIGDIKSLLGNIAQFLSEYIFCHDVVIDADSGLYSNFYFKLKYDEAVKSRARGGNGFAAMLIALFRDGAPDRGVVAEIVRGLSKKIMERLEADDIATLHDDRISVLLAGAGKERAIAAGEDLLDYLSGLSVKTGSGVRIALKPCIGLTSTDMIGTADDPLKSARQNLEYALLSEESRLEYSKIREM
jgi:hypothetical protein